MKKFYLLLLMLTFGCFYGQNAGIYDAYIITQNPAENNGDLFYHHAPDWNGVNLGTFTKEDQMFLRGGQAKTFKNNGANVTGVDMNYLIYPVGNRPSPQNWNTITLSWISNDPNTPGNQIWQTDNSATSLVAGLDNGTYDVEVYFVAHTSVGDQYYSNNGNNYIASLTINNSSLAVSDLQNAKQNFVANGQFYTNKKGNLSLQVIDYSGRVLKTLNVKADGNPIDLEIREKGQYILVVSAADGKRQSIKFVQ